MTEKNVSETAVASNSNYDEGMIRVLNDVEHVRTRPGMYIGGNNVTRAAPPGLRNRRQLDRRSAGRLCQEHPRQDQCRRQRARVADDGRGIPVGIHPDGKDPHGRSRLRHARRRRQVRPQGRLRLHHQRRPARRRRIGRQFPLRMARSRSQPRRQGPSHGVRARRQEASDLKVIGKATKTGTKVTFKPDQRDLPRRRIQIRNARRPPARAGLSERRACRSSSRTSASASARNSNTTTGLVEYVQSLNEGKNVLHPQRHLFQEGRPGNRLIVEVAHAVQRRLQRNASSPSPTTSTTTTAART